MLDVLGRGLVDGCSQGQMPWSQMDLHMEEKCREPEGTLASHVKRLNIQGRDWSDFLP
jgi:hypothetical protein